MKPSGLPDLPDLPDRCRAAVATAPATTEYRDLPLPEVGPDDGLLRVEAAGICGTGWGLYGRESRGRDLGPLILGHENVGTVVAVGERAAERWGVDAGDRVAVEELTLMGVRGHDQRSVEPAIDLLRSGRFPLRLLCTHAFGPHEVDHALRVAGARLDPEAIHVSVLP